MSLVRKRVLFFLTAIPVFGLGFSTQPPTKNYNCQPVAGIEIDSRRADTFHKCLSDGIAANPHISPANAARIKLVLDGPDSVKKRILLRFFERHARAHVAHLTGANAETIDWAHVDWPAILDVILKLLLLILPLL